jgi:ERCC4-related helicase
MSAITTFQIVESLVLGSKRNEHVPDADQDRQKRETIEILKRLQFQPGVVLADEVGMGKTFVALAVAYCVGLQSKRGPVVVMAPPNLIDKWSNDLKTFCELYVSGRNPIDRNQATPNELRATDAFRYGIARSSVDFLKLLDDPARVRCHIVFLAQGSMARRQSDKWVRLALVREAFRRHARGKSALVQVRKVAHRFMAELLQALGEQSASGWKEYLWNDLLHKDPREWRDIYNAEVGNQKRQLADNPVPEAVLKALEKGKLDLRPLADALEQMPLRKSEKLSNRLTLVRRELKRMEEIAWRDLLAKASWRSPLLIMDEAHHLKNPSTNLARQLQSPDTDEELQAGEGALSRAFDRMLFLTATPFQLGHQELIRVLRRFGDIHWNETSECMEPPVLHQKLDQLGEALTESQRAAIHLQKCWQRLGPTDLPADVDPTLWWRAIQEKDLTSLTPRQRSLRESYEKCLQTRRNAEEQLRPWLIRFNKTDNWTNLPVKRRIRFCGAAIRNDQLREDGLPVPSGQLLPFFLAARSAAAPGKELLGEALCSSYEAFRHTRQHNQHGRDEEEMQNSPTLIVDSTHSDWYLQEFDRALLTVTGAAHPKVAATVGRVVDLWEQGEKVLVFAFYRQTCRALRHHISNEVEQRNYALARRRLAAAGQTGVTDDAIDELVAKIQRSYFDDLKMSGRQILDVELSRIVDSKLTENRGEDISTLVRDELVDIMRRFMRVSTTLVRAFPIHQLETVTPEQAVRVMLNHEDGSKFSWRRKFDNFIDFFVRRCSAAERDGFLEAGKKISTGAIRIKVNETLSSEQVEEKEGVTTTLANVQEATGLTDRDQRTRLMRAFNTPFFPDILVCSEVMGEGVDLHRYCRNVIHHDLAWNPSQIEQRTGRVDRLGCKAENRNSIHVYLPYVAGASDERQFRVMRDREQWFRIVMGQDEVTKLIPNDDAGCRPNLPLQFVEQLSFNLEI